MHTFESWLAELARRKIDFTLVGGLAVGMCGFSRTTIVMDILVSTEKDNLKALLEALGNFGEGSGAELTEEDFRPEEGCIRILEDFPLDIFTRMSGYSYDDLLPYANSRKLENDEIKHLSAEGLIMLKKSSERLKDRLDCEALARILAEEKDK
ncbi:MAG: hypothetical protein ACOC54_01100 [Candidatus Sumerlaeota bacterium]